MTDYQILRRLKKIRNMVGYIPNSKEYAWDEIVRHLVEPSLEYLDELIEIIQAENIKEQPGTISPFNSDNYREYEGK